jgi:hypothetical protein
MMTDCIPIMMPVVSRTRSHDLAFNDSDPPTQLERLWVDKQTIEVKWSRRRRRRATYEDLTYTILRIVCDTYYDS